ncbi:MAG: DUF1440 domain-containing protein [candidate division Zixibacteria bacterium]|nr:DUF1440 domain-containing protein [candidate division Zixibacteria bacterium]MCI0596004.1 DUF1440 domain-containing protein [candidate division Zixibacteria bacterium]
MNFKKALTAGFVATLAMTMLMYVAPMMGMPKMDIAAMLGGMLGGGMPEPMGGAWLVGMLIHFVNGTIIFPLIFAFLLYSRFPGAPVVKGILWGLILWFLAQIMVMPMMGAGFFAGNTPQPFMTVFGSLMGHLVYGVILGWLYRPQGAIPAMA